MPQIFPDTASRPGRALGWILFLFSFLVFLSTSSEETVYYRSEPGVLRFFLTQSIVEQGQISIPSSIGVRGEGGESYSWWGIGATFLTIPLYHLGGLLDVSPARTLAALNQLITAATVVLVYLFASALGCRPKRAVLGALLYGFATFAWPFAKLPFGHPNETFFVLLTFLLVFGHSRSGRNVLLVYAGISLGMAFLTRPSALLVLVALAPMVLPKGCLRNRRFCPALVQSYGPLVAGLLPAVLLYAYYNQQRFGSIFETGYSLIAQRLGVDFFFGSSPLVGVSGLLFSPGKSFFLYSPIALLALWTWKPFARRFPRLFYSFLLFAALHLILIANNIFWHGDWTWGPRYLLVLTPFPVLILTSFMEYGPWGRRHAVLFGVIAAWSLLMQVCAVAVNHELYFHHLSRKAKIPFIELRGDGVQPIIEPPAGVYFDPQLSAIPLQLKFLARALGEDCHTSRLEGLDFWWYEPRICRE